MNFFINKSKQYLNKLCNFLLQPYKKGLTFYMNQIISNFVSNSDNNKASSTITSTNNKTFNKTLKIRNKRKLFIFLFIIFVIISMCLSIYYINSKHNISKLDKISKNIAKTYGITKIYNNSDNYNYSSTLLNNEISFYEESESYIIGTISIEKIDITYPILSSISKENLKFSTCRFYGPMPNKIGNLCIAGHNYKNNTFFSNLSKLENNDIIKIQDNSRKNSKI